MTHQNDQYYIDLTLNGEVDAFSELIERYKHMVYTLSIRMMKHTEEAEEVAQDVFIKAFQKLNTFKGTSKFSTWLYRITYNKCLDELSRKRNRPTYHSEELIDDITDAGIDSVLVAIENRELRSEIEACIQQLKEEDAFLVTLYYLEEQTLEEIAETTGMTKTNVKVRIFRSRKKLYDIMTTQLSQETVARYDRK